MLIIIKKLRFSFFIFLLIFCTSGWAKIYKWTDDNGNVQYTDKPPAEHEAKVIGDEGDKKKKTTKPKSRLALWLDKVTPKGIHIQSYHLQGDTLILDFHADYSAAISAFNRNLHDEKLDKIDSSGRAVKGKKDLHRYTIHDFELDFLMAKGKQNESTQQFHSKNPEATFWNAVSMGDEEQIKQLLKRGVYVNNSNKKGETALMVAISQKRYSLVDFLLKAGANPNSKNIRGTSVLHYAINSTDKDKVIPLLNSLINAGASLDTTSSKGKPVFHIAAEKNLIDVLGFFIKNGVDVNVASKQGRTALFGASTDATVFLIEHGADVNKDSDSGSTALMHSVGYGANKIQDLKLKVKYLLKHGSNVNKKDKHGNTALHNMMNLGVLDPEKGGVEVLSLLLESGADVNAPTNSGEVPFYTLVARTSKHFEKHKKLYQLMLKYGTNIKYQNEYGSNILVHSNFKAIRFLVENGANINARDKNGATILMISAINGELDKVKLLIELKADTTVQDKTGLGASCYARKSLVRRYGLPPYRKSNYGKANSYQQIEKIMATYGDKKLSPLPLRSDPIQKPTPDMIHKALKDCQAV